ncbi:uncharacterized protein LOC144705862 [Wolffia australiana]
MKRKKWTEEEEAALIEEYSAMAASGVLSTLKTRESKFQPIADRVNSLHHLRDPLAFPFRWSWRDVSIKIQNMRHQFLGVKQKIRLPSSPSHSPSFDWPSGDTLWPNFLRYKLVFGDDPEPISVVDQASDGDEGGGFSADLGQALLGREEGRCKREREEEETAERRWRREEEEMEWRERLMGLQMEHEKRMMQMHLEACQAQAQIVGFLVRFVGQFLGAADGGFAGISSQVFHGLQLHQQQQQQPQQLHRQQDPPSMGGDNGKSDASSADPYI